MTANPLAELSLTELRERTSAKWSTYPTDVLPLWIAEMDVPLAPAVRAALRDAVERGDTGYPAGTGYAEALRDFARDRWGWSGVDVGRTAVVADVMTGIVEAIRLITDPGDVVVVTPPVYAPFHAFVTHAGRRVVEAPLGADGRLDAGGLERAFVAARARSDRPVLLLCNPHNPTGAVHTRAELEHLAGLAGRHGVRIVSDEIHAPLVLDGARFTPLLSVRGADTAFALFSASKAWNLAGLKAALLVAGPEAVDDLARLPEVVGHGPSHLGVLAHTAALRDGRDWLDALLVGLAGNRRLLTDLVTEHLPTTGLYRPEATYLGWLDCRRLGVDEPAADGPAALADLAGPARFFLDHAGVAVSSGHAFGTGGRGHVRINFATSPEILTEAVTRMGRAVTDPGSTAGLPGPAGRSR
jgi:cystathionine beta-lyase